MNKDFYHTKCDNGYFRDINPYCVYCGKRIDNPVVTKKGYYFWHCDCPEAKKEYEINLKIQELKKELPKPKYEVVEQWVDGYSYPLIKEIK